MKENTIKMAEIGSVIKKEKGTKQKGKRNKTQQRMVYNEKYNYAGGEKNEKKISSYFFMPIVFV